MPVNDEKNPYINGTGILSHDLAKQLLDHRSVPIFSNPYVPIFYKGNPQFARLGSINFSSFKEPIAELKLVPTCIFLNPFNSTVES